MAKASGWFAIPGLPPMVKPATLDSTVMTTRDKTVVLTLRHSMDRAALVTHRLLQHAVPAVLFTMLPTQLVLVLQLLPAAPSCSECSELNVSISLNRIGLTIVNTLKIS